VTQTLNLVLDRINSLKMYFVQFEKDLNKIFWNTIHEHFKADYFFLTFSSSFSKQFSSNSLFSHTTSSPIKKTFALWVGTWSRSCWRTMHPQETFSPMSRKSTSTLIKKKLTTFHPTAHRRIMAMTIMDHLLEISKRYQ
jgi:hypothetical protein